MPKQTAKVTAGLRALAVGLLALLGSITVSSVVLPDIAVAQAVRDIRVAGNQRVTSETVRSYLQFSPGDAYDAGKVDQSIRSLFATGLFRDVRIDRTNTGVLVAVVENPVVKFQITSLNLTILNRQFCSLKVNRVHLDKYFCSFQFFFEILMDDIFAQDHEVKCA